MLKRQNNQIFNKFYSFQNKTKTLMIKLNNKTKLKNQK